MYDLKRKSRFHFFQKNPPFLGGTVVNSTPYIIIRNFSLMLLRQNTKIKNFRFWTPLNQGVKVTYLKSNFYFYTLLKRYLA